VIPANTERRIEAAQAARALVCSRAGATVTTAEGSRALPWAA
jgi:hypothetical protein